jgi:Fe2+ transport system protein FeoA
VTNLAGIRPGRQAKILGFSANLPPDRLAHLLAYGLLPGRQVQVLQHTPVTVVQIEHFELALERALAREIRVEEE